MVLKSLKTATCYVLLSVCSGVLLLLIPSSSIVAENEPQSFSLLRGQDGDVVSVKLKHRFVDKELGTFDGFDPTTRVFATTNQGSVHLWDTQTGKLKLTLAGYQEITRTYFVPDGRTIVTSGKEKGSRLFATKIWDAETGIVKATLDGYVLLGPGKYDGNNLTVITIADKELRFWNAESGKLRKAVTGYTELHSDWHFFTDSLISSNGETCMLKVRSSL